MLNKSLKLKKVKNATRNLTTLGADLRNILAQKYGVTPSVIQYWFTHRNKTNKIKKNSIVVTPVDSTEPIAMATIYINDVKVQLNARKFYINNHEIAW
jgi:LysM repeat protein